MANRIPKHIRAKDVYRMAYNRAQSAANQHGHPRLSPSIAERRDFEYAWGDFMAGWRAGLRDWNRD